MPTICGETFSDMWLKNCEIKKKYETCSTVHELEHLNACTSQDYGYCVDMACMMMSSCDIQIKFL